MVRIPIGIGLIGVGRHGLRYVRHIVEDVTTARLTAVCRQHPEQGFRLPGGEAVRVFGETEALIASPDVDVVMVVTPPMLSRDICLQAVRARKPILIEKPLSISAEDARIMVEAAGRAGVPLMTGQTLRFDSTIQALRQQRGLIGRSQRLTLTSHIESRQTKPEHAAGYGKRGAVLEIGVHMLDLVRFLTGEEIREVRCTMDAVPPAAPETRATVDLLTEEGTECSIEIARVPTGRAGTAQWTGSEGQLSANWMQRQLQWIGRTGSKEWASPPCATVLSTITEFLQAVTTQQPMPITGDDGYRAVEIAEACYRSAQSGGASIRLPLAP